MARPQSKKKLVVIIALLVGVMLVIGAVYAKRNSQLAAESTTGASSQEPVGEAVTDSAADNSTTDATDSDAETKPGTETSTPDATPVDPETLSSVDIEPLSIIVFYAKGTPGFEFLVNRTADQTQYVDFTSPDLVGTKCTDDAGIFASIIKNPATESQTTITQTVKVAGDTYGLSLAGVGCTSDVALLGQYQDAFSYGFSSLVAL
jgi:hypothetical protein